MGFYTYIMVTSNLVQCTGIFTYSHLILVTTSYLQAERYLVVPDVIRLGCKIDKLTGWSRYEANQMLSFKSHAKKINVLEML
jgi:hypothetical protein